MSIVKRSRAKTTQRIVEALEAVIAERGLDGVGVNRIADKAGVSKVLIYRYFGSVEGLITYYVKMGKLFPIFSAEALEQIYPLHKSDLARVWYRQVIQLYRSFRASKTAREILKAGVVENGTVATATTRAVDQEMTRLVDQLSFVKGADTQALSAVLLGAMSYLTILAQNDQPMIGLDMRSETEWKRIEEAIKLIYTAVGKVVVTTEAITLPGQPATLPVESWQ